MRDPYLVLNVAREAGEAEIRGAYRPLVKRYHPDLNPDRSRRRRALSRDLGGLRAS